MHKPEHCIKHVPKPIRVDLIEDDNKIGRLFQYIVGIFNCISSVTLCVILPTLEMSQSTSQKHQCFTSEPLGSKACTAVAGIGPTLGKRLEEEGFDSAKTLLGQYLLLKGNQELFVHWLKEICGANSKQAKDCWSCLSEWEDQFM